MSPESQSFICKDQIGEKKALDFPSLFYKYQDPESRGMKSFRIFAGINGKFFIEKLQFFRLNKVMV